MEVIFVGIGDGMEADMVDSGGGGGDICLNLGVGGADNICRGNHLESHGCGGGLLSHEHLDALGIAVGLGSHDG